MRDELKKKFNKGRKEEPSRGQQVEKEEWKGERGEPD